MPEICDPTFQSCDPYSRWEPEHDAVQASPVRPAEPREVDWDKIARPSEPPPPAFSAKASAMPLMSPNAYTDAALDREADQLRANVGRAAEYPERRADEARLRDVEAEQTKRASVAKAVGSSSSVEFCTRVADLPGNSLFGVEHWWLKTPNVAAGMGPANGDVPGHGGVDLPGDPTKVTDHSKETGPGVHCFPVDGEDQACVERHLEIGKSTGPWLPWNQCHTFVSGALDDCRLPPDDGSGLDGGAP